MDDSLIILFVFVFFIILIYVNKAKREIKNGMKSWFVDAKSKSDHILIIIIIILGVLNIVISLVLGVEIFDSEGKNQIEVENQIFYYLSLFVVTYSIGLGTIAISLINNEEEKTYFIYSIFALLLLSSNLFLLQYIKLHDIIYFLYFYSPFVVITITLFIAIEKIQNRNN